MTDHITKRVIAMPMMRKLLNALADAHEISHERHVNADRLWRRVSKDMAGKNAHIDAALAAGFMDDNSSHSAIKDYRLHITALGRSAIDRPAPFWMEGRR